MNLNLSFSIISQKPSGFIQKLTVSLLKYAQKNVNLT